MNILIVGAGAVGLVYGHHFANAGHQVTFLVKEKYQTLLNQEKKKHHNNSSGVPLYHLNTDKKLLRPQYFNQFDTITEWHQIQDIDVIALAISSNALRQLPRSAINNMIQRDQSKLLMLQPSATDFEYLNEEISAETIFQGMISLISYQTDDVNRQIKPAGTAYYLPPMPMPISASFDREKVTTRTATEANQHLQTIVSLFNNSGISAKAVKSAINESRLPSAFLMTFLCALEAADWQFKRLRKTPLLLRKLGAAQRALLPQQLAGNSLIAKGKRLSLTFLMALLLRPFLYKFLLRIAPWCVPLPLEAYLKKHFLKVRAQTVIYMQEYYDAHPVKAIEELNQLLHHHASGLSVKSL